MPFKSKGQATVELILSVGVLVTVYLSMHQVLIPAIDDSTARLVNARKAIWSRVRDRELTILSGDYRLNSHTKGVLTPLNRLLPLNLEGNNLRELKRLDARSYYQMSRLTNSWQAKSSNELASRPASLVVNNALSGEVTWLIQDGLGWIFLAEELNSDSLIFGTISPDVIPEEAYK